MSKNWMESRYTIGSLVARSSAMQRMIPEALAAANSSHRLLILGQPGVGKKLLARAIHYSGTRSSRPFVAVSCERLYPDNVGKVFFGDARTNIPGKLEEASEGTLLLSNIEDLCPIAQERLLAILQSETYTTTLGERRINDARIIVTADRDAIEERVSEGSFASALFEKLSETTIAMPSLEEREADLPYLVNDLMKDFATKAKIDAPAVPFHYMELLTRVEWPQNVQQLRNHLESVMVLSEGIFEPEILLAHFDEIESPQTIRAAVQSLLTRLSDNSNLGIASADN